MSEVKCNQLFRTLCDAMFNVTTVAESYARFLRSKQEALEVFEAIVRAVIVSEEDLSEVKALAAENHLTPSSLFPVSNGAFITYQDVLDAHHRFWTDRDESDEALIIDACVKGEITFSMLIQEMNSCLLSGDVVATSMEAVSKESKAGIGNLGALTVYVRDKIKDKYPGIQSIDAELACFEGALDSSSSVEDKASALLDMVNGAWVEQDSEDASNSMFVFPSDSLLMTNFGQTPAAAWATTLDINLSSVSEAVKSAKRCMNSIGKFARSIGKKVASAFSSYVDLVTERINFVKTKAETQVFEVPLYQGSFPLGRLPVSSQSNDYRYHIVNTREQLVPMSLDEMRMLLIRSLSNKSLCTINSDVFQIRLRPKWNSGGINDVYFRSEASETPGTIMYRLGNDAQNLIHYSTAMTIHNTFKGRILTRLNDSGEWNKHLSLVEKYGCTYIHHEISLHGYDLHVPSALKKVRVSMSGGSDFAEIDMNGAVPAELMRSSNPKFVVSFNTQSKTVWMTVICADLMGRSATFDVTDRVSMLRDVPELNRGASIVVHWFLDATASTSDITVTALKASISVESGGPFPAFMKKQEASNHPLWMDDNGYISDDLMVDAQITLKPVVPAKHIRRHLSKWSYGTVNGHPMAGLGAVLKMDAGINSLYHEAAVTDAILDLIDIEEDGRMALERPSTSDDASMVKSIEYSEMCVYAFLASLASANDETPIPANKVIVYSESGYDLRSCLNLNRFFVPNAIQDAWLNRGKLPFRHYDDLEGKTVWDWLDMTFPVEDSDNFCLTQKDHVTARAVLESLLSVACLRWALSTTRGMVFSYSQGVDPIFFPYAIDAVDNTPTYRIATTADNAKRMSKFFGITAAAYAIVAVVAATIILGPIASRAAANASLAVGKLTAQYNAEKDPAKLKVLAKQIRKAKKKERMISKVCLFRQPSVQSQVAQNFVIHDDVKQEDQILDTSEFDEWWADVLGDRFT